MLVQQSARRGCARQERVDRRSQVFLRIASIRIACSCTAVLSWPHLTLVLIHTFPRLGQMANCITPGCVRQSTGKHRKCCSTCATGVHSRRCDRDYHSGERLVISTCLTAACNRLVSQTHLHCCSTCRATNGTEHKPSCALRQSGLAHMLQTQQQQQQYSATTTSSAASSTGSVPSRSFLEELD